MNLIIPKPDCVQGEVYIRYVLTTKRIYIESPPVRSSACVTLDYIFNQINGGPPLYKNDDGSYYLTEDMYILDGITLQIKNEELRLKSDSQTVINLRAHGGSLDIEDSKIISWDPESNGPDENIDDGRSYISCLSETITDPGLTCDGSAKNNMGEGRMDITRSEISYLGYYASESWGLTYKVRALCKDKSNPDVMDQVKVYGNIVDSDIHHMYHGHYSYGHVGGNWSGNTIHDNHGYGYDPHDFSRNETIENNVVYNNGIHGIIGSKWCTDLHIRNNIVYNSKVGIFLHKNSDRAIVENNEVYGNQDSGIVFLESTDALIRNNKVYNNVIGTRLSVGSRNLIFENNEFEDNGEYEIYTYEGSDTLVELDTKTVQNVLFRGNSIGGEGIKLQESKSIQFVENSIFLTGSIDIGDSTQILFEDNALSYSGLKVSDGHCFNTMSTIGDIFCDTFEGVIPGTSSIVADISTTRDMVTFSPTSSPTGVPEYDTMSPTVSTIVDTLSPENLSRGDFLNSSGRIIPSIVGIITIVVTFGLII